MESINHSIWEIVKLEFMRNFRLNTRRNWSLIYTFFIQITFVMIIYTSLRLRNFSTDEEMVKLLIFIFVTFQVFSLPAFTIMLTYDNFVQDPVLQLFVVASTDRSRFLLGKSIATSVFVYLIFNINSILGLIIVSFIFPDPILLSSYLSITISFLIVVQFYTISNIFLLLLVQRMVNDKVSLIFLPLTIFYIIPFLLVNSLSYEVFNPTITNFSPTVWVLRFVSLLLFEIKAEIELTYLPLIVVLLTIASNYLFNRYELD